MGSVTGNFWRTYHVCFQWLNLAKMKISPGVIKISMKILPTVSKTDFILSQPSMLISKKLHKLGFKEIVLMQQIIY